jgi:hypothetical protein
MSRATWPTVTEVRHYRYKVGGVICGARFLRGGKLHVRVDPIEEEDGKNRKKCGQMTGGHVLGIVQHQFGIKKCFKMYYESHLQYARLRDHLEMV